MKYKEDIKYWSPWVCLVIAFVFIAAGGLNEALYLEIKDEYLALGCGFSMIFGLVLIILFWILDL